ncbi:hypothetical protein BBJ28_00022608 [Nothophytophthora sp. Chile5]|nr:hypothetical protein BBJ28_00022608 [Nothophytophthora sp. Chile5]
MGGEGLDISDESNRQPFSPRMSAYLPHSASPNSLQYQPVPRAHHASAGMTSSPSSSVAAASRADGQAYMASAAPSTGACLVCYGAQVDVVLEPCRHQFHATCIERWLTKDKVCPICWTPTQTPRRAVAQYAPLRTGHTSPDGYPVDSKAHVLDGTSHNAAGTAAANAGANADQPPPNPPTAMRKGKWTAEESAYCDRLIEEFKKGNLPLAEGTTLRTFLSKLLNCDPMRISKKYTGDQCIGKIIFRRREDEVSKEDMELIRKDLAELEKTYLEREQYNQRRREKRLESELSRDKSRFVAARTIGYTAAANSRPPQGGGGYTSSAAQVQPMRKPDNAGAGSGQQPHNAAAYGATGRAGMPVQPPRHPLQAAPPNGAAASHLFNHSDHGVAMLGIAGTQSQSADASKPSSAGPEAASDAFPRVSSIDSFSCLFPRVASIENFQQQHAASAGFGGGYGGPDGYDGHGNSNSNAGGLVKSLSIGDGLNAYFPRIQSLEQLSSLLQEHAPSSPRGAAAAASGTLGSQLSTRDESASENSSSQAKEQLSGGRRRLGADKEEQQREADVEARRPSSNGSSSKRLSPNHSAAAGAGNQIQIPKPLSKMPRSSSGIFPRVPSMDKLPRVPSLDKLPRVASLDKLPRIPSMDKLHSMGSEQRIPRVPSNSDMLSRFGSSDHLSSFPSFSNLSALSSSASYDKLSSLGAVGVGGIGFKSGFPRNSSIEDILSLVASSESTTGGGLGSGGSTLQLSALAAVAGEESSHLANERKRRLEQDSALTAADAKKSRLSA